MGIVPAGERGTLGYYTGVYTFTGGGVSFSSPFPIRLAPTDPAHHFILESYRRPVKGRGQVNFNAYRGTLEYRYSPKSKLPYIINELLLEHYVAGIAESSNDVAPEYAKALLTAARTYAYAHIRPGPPTDGWLFDVYPTTQDQIYLGYNSELMMPAIAAAAAATAGEMVTFNGKPVITPYFGHSNGRTLSWKGAGKNARPWLTRVAAKYDKGKQQWGHGIGMSTRDASLRALKDGWGYRRILEYYYTGTAVAKVY
jgi:peptidoglycan hydrolase-like amidase